MKHMLVCLNCMCITLLVHITSSEFAARYFCLLVNFTYPCQPSHAASDVAFVVFSDVPALLSFSSCSLQSSFFCSIFLSSTPFQFSSRLLCSTCSLDFFPLFLPLLLLFSVLFLPVVSCFFIFLSLTPSLVFTYISSSSPFFFCFVF